VAWIRYAFGTHTPVDQVSAGSMELRPRSGISGSQTKPRAMSVDRKREGNSLDDTITTLVNPPSSATGITRGGKSPSRILPAEGGRIRTEGNPGKAETRAGELRPFDYLEQKQR